MALSPSLSGLTVSCIAQSANSTVTHQSVRSLGAGIGYPTWVNGRKPARNIFLAECVRCVSSVPIMHSDFGLNCWTGGGAATWRAEPSFAEVVMASSTRVVVYCLMSSSV